MKKLILLLPLFLFLQSCENDEPKDIFGDSLDSSKNSYTICYNIDTDEALGVVASNFHYEIDLKIAEYNSDNEIVATHLWENIRKGNSRKFTANKRAIKLVIQHTTTIYGNNIEKSYSFFILNVFYLDEYNYIEINDNTLTSDYNPIN